MKPSLAYVLLICSIFCRHLKSQLLILEPFGQIGRFRPGAVCFYLPTEVLRLVINMAAPANNAQLRNAVAIKSKVPFFNIIQMMICGNR